MSTPTRLRRGAAAAVTGAFALGGLVAVTTAPAQAFDPSCEPAPPALTSLNVSPTQVNVKTGERTVVVSGTTSGPRLDYVFITGEPVGKGHDRFAYANKPSAGSFSIKMVVPKGAANGKHMLSVSLASEDGYESYEDEELAGMGMPSFFNVISKPDHKAPVLKKIRFSTKKVNTTKKAARFKVTATVSEKGGSGLEGATVSIGKGKKFVGHVYLSPKKGKLVGKAVVPKWVGNAKATVVSASVADKAGNRTDYPETKKLTGKLKPKLKVTSKKDAKAPTVGNVSVSPTSGKVGDRRWQVSYAVKASDKQSGVAAVTVALEQQDSEYSYPMAMAYLDNKKGTWVGKSTIECWYSPGTYDVVVTTTDRVGNESTVRRGTVTLTP